MNLTPYLVAGIYVVMAGQTWSRELQSGVLRDRHGGAVFMASNARWSGIPLPWFRRLSWAAIADRSRTATDRIGTRAGRARARKRRSTVCWREQVSCRICPWSSAWERGRIVRSGSSSPSFPDTSSRARRAHLFPTSCEPPVSSRSCGWTALPRRSAKPRSSRFARSFSGPRRSERSPWPTSISCTARKSGSSRALLKGCRVFSRNFAVEPE